MEVLLRILLPRWLQGRATFEVYPFRGKPDLLRKLRSRLSAYSRFIPADWRIIVLVDCDGDRCEDLKSTMEEAAAAAHLGTKARSRDDDWRVVTRIAIEELEAWYFGDWEAVRAAFPRLDADVPRKSRFRDPDAIEGGTWEALESLMKAAGYFRGGLRKVELARIIAARLEADRSTSRSFRAFRHAVLASVNGL